MLIYLLIGSIFTYWLLFPKEYLTHPVHEEFWSFRTLVKVATILFITILWLPIVAMTLYRFLSRKQ